MDFLGAAHKSYVRVTCLRGFSRLILNTVGSGVLELGGEPAPRDIQGIALIRVFYRGLSLRNLLCFSSMSFQWQPYPVGIYLQEP
jgi:hypothetical protein